MVMAWSRGVHAERTPWARHPAFPQGGFAAPVAPAFGGFRLASELGKKLGPNRNHPNEQRNRRQRSGLFNKHSQHRRTPDTGTYEEQCSFFVPGVKGRKRVSLKNDPGG